MIFKRIFRCGSGEYLYRLVQVDIMHIAYTKTSAFSLDCVQIIGYNKS